MANGLVNLGQRMQVYHHNTEFIPLKTTKIRVNKNKTNQAEATLIKQFVVRMAESVHH